VPWVSRTVKKHHGCAYSNLISIVPDSLTDLLSVKTGSGVQQFGATYFGFLSISRNLASRTEADLLRSATPSY
jgi:hypothetical protein